MKENLTELSSKISYNSAIIGNWIAFDLEWQQEPLSTKNTTIIASQHPYSKEVTSATSEPPTINNENYQKVLTFAYEDSHGNIGAIDVTDFNSQHEFLADIKDKLLQHKYCFAWGSKAVKHKNEQTGNLEGIYGDLYVLDTNFKANGIYSIIRYDSFSGEPYIKGNNKSGSSTTDIDLLRVFVKPLVKYVMFKNKYKGLHLDEVAKALLGYGKLENKTGADISEMSADERKAYCLQDAHIVAELIKVKNGDILKIMQVIANHTGLRVYEVCHKGMNSIWTKILNDAIYKKVSLVGYDNIPSVLRKLYSNNQAYAEYEQEKNGFYTETDWDDEEYQGYDNDGEERDELNQHYEQTANDHSNYSTYQRQEHHNNNAKECYPKYKGAIVLEPQKGLHHDVYLFDVTSLYPSMIIKYNLSPETVNCLCCKNNPKAKEMITSEILKDCSYIPAKDEGRYWICQRKKGLFAKILSELTEQRIRYKNAALEVESQAIKAIINSGYGVFGHPYFKYYDPRVAELVTAFGRDTLAKMQAIANELDFYTLYGDTDSLFANHVKSINGANNFIAECKSKLGIDVGHEKTFSKLILVGKKHYIGIPSDPTKDIIIKGMEGIKSDRPEFIRRVFRQLVDDIRNEINPFSKLKQALYQLENRQVSPELLAISLVMRKNPEEYDQICKQTRLGTKLGLRKGDTLVYYKCDITETVYDSKKKKHVLKTVHESANPADASYAEYKKMVINSIRDVLQILGYDTQEDLLLGHKTQLAQGSSHIKDTYVSTINSPPIQLKTNTDDSVTIEEKQRKQLVLEGIEVILSLFVAAAQQRLFPRTIMTKHTKGQIVVYSKEEIMHYFRVARYEDCRINAYPAFLSKAEEQDYKKGINLNLFAPNILFIDLDAKIFKSDKELQRILKRILKNVAYLLHDIKPLVLWSGHGYHIIIPVNCKEALEHNENFTQYTREPSKEFLQFAERLLSLSKADPANNPSFKSCLLRVPYTFNSKCIEEGIEDAEVKIVQLSDSSQPLPEIDNLLVEFQTYLIDKKLKAEVKEEKTVKNRHYSCNSADIHNKIPYIEKLLNQSLEDYRKAAISLILAPYFVNVQKLTDADSFSRIEEWVLKCNQVKKLEPSLDYFDDLINRAIERAKETGIKPLKFEDTLQYKNKELYEMLL